MSPGRYLVKRLGGSELVNHTGREMNQFIANIQTIIVLQGFVFAAFLVIGKRTGQLANKILCLLLAALALHMTLNLSGHFGIGCAMLAMLYGPLLFTYTRSLTDKHYALRSLHLLHGLPPVLILLSILMLSIAPVYYAIPIALSLGGYGLAAGYYLSRYKASMGDTLPGKERLIVRWLSCLIAVKLSLIVVNSVNVGFSLAGFDAMASIGRTGLYLWLLVYVNFVMFAGLLHPTLFMNIPPATSSSAPVPSAAEIAETLRDVEHVMTQTKAFLNPDLTLSSLARKLTVPPRQISVAVNRGRGQAFSDYVNEFRIEHAKSLLLSAPQSSMTVIDVMLDSGFNSKSNFYRAFKALTGMTPVEYRDRQLGQDVGLSLAE